MKGTTECEDSWHLAKLAKAITEAGGGGGGGGKDTECLLIKEEKLFLLPQGMFSHLSELFSALKGCLLVCVCVHG